MVKAKIYIFEKQFDGWPKETDLKLIEEELPSIKDGEFLAEAIYLSVDPYMRAYAPRLAVGTTFIGSQIARVVESKNTKFPEGAHVVGYFGWRTHTISDGEKVDGTFKAPMILPDFGDLPLSYGLGILGMPGNTAYFGFLELCEPKAGETVVVTAAGGAVGILVGQIAKIKACKVIGVVGSDEKGKWIVEELGYDHFINYNTTDLKIELPKLAPDGIDCYFDNVGGEIATTILNNMNLFGRIAICGCISAYNDMGLKASMVQPPILFQQLKMEGFLVLRWEDMWLEGILEIKKWIEEGKLKYRETVTEGFENMFNAFMDMLKGKNFGKAIVKV